MNVLAIGGHFDDVELGCGGTIVKHLKNKDNVYILIITDSEYENYNGKMLRTRGAALREGRQAAKILGIKPDHFICKKWFKAKKVPYSVELIEKLNEVIDELKIDTIYTHWMHDLHQDHFAIARATLIAARHVPRILMYRSNWYMTDVPFKGNFFVDISAYMETKIKALKEYKTERKKRGKSWINFIKYQNRNSGIEMGVEYTEVFEIIKWLA